MTLVILFQKYIFVIIHFIYFYTSSTTTTIKNNSDKLITLWSYTLFTLLLYCVQETFLCNIINFHYACFLLQYVLSVEYLSVYGIAISFVKIFRDHIYTHSRAYTGHW